MEAGGANAGIATIHIGGGSSVRCCGRAYKASQDAKNVIKSSQTTIVCFLLPVGAKLKVDFRFQMKKPIFA